MKTKILLFTLLLSLSFTGCESNTDNNEDNATPQNLSYEKLKLEVPENAAQVVKNQALIFNAYLGLFNSYGALGSNPSKSGDSWTWSVTYNTITVSISATQQQDASMMWQYKINDSSSDPSFDNWVMMDATLSKDAKSGSYNIYESNSTVKALSATFNTENGTRTATTTLYDLGEVEYTFTSVVNSDGSGSFVKKNSADEILFEASWTSNGVVTYNDHSK